MNVQQIKTIRVTLSTPEAHGLIEHCRAIPDNDPKKEAANTIAAALEAEMHVPHDVETGILLLINIVP